MRTILLTVAGASMLLTSTAIGQGLSERIAGLRQQQNRRDAVSEKAHILGTILYTDLSVQFQETQVKEAFNYLQTVMGISIVGRYIDDRNFVGLDPEAPVTLNVTDRPAISIIEMVLDQASDDPATWQIREGYLEVGPKERLGAKNAQFIRYYPIRDLLFEPPRFDNAPQLDLDTALNQGNNQGGGGGRGGGGAGGGGGGGAGGGGGSGGGSGGSIFTGGDEEIESADIGELADQIIAMIQELVEPEGWTDVGGDWATIRYYSGTLIVRAPDFVHRQIGGYPYAPRRPGMSGVGQRTTGRRYVQWTGSASHVELADMRGSGRLGGTTGTPGTGESRSSSSRDSDSSKDSNSSKDSSSDSSSSSNRDSDSSSSSSSSSDRNRSGG